MRARGERRYLDNVDIATTEPLSLDPLENIIAALQPMADDVSSNHYSPYGKQPTPHPPLLTSLLRLRQFRDEDTDAMHGCFARPMRFWNTPVHTKRTEIECAVRRFIDCTPSYHRFWVVADSGTDRCLGMVNFTMATSAISAWPSDTSSIPASPPKRSRLMIRMLIVGYCFGIRSERGLWRGGPSEPRLPLVLPAGARRRSPRSLNLLEEPPRPVS
jgi:hypothetical protein